MPSIYGIIISIAILCCIIVAERIVKNDQQDSNTLWQLGLKVLTLGFICARLYHVVDYFSYYSQHPIKIFAVWEGGLGIWGGIIGGALAVLMSANNKLYWADVITTVLPLGQAIGRWGNYVNQENFGYPTDLPWAIFIKEENRPNGFKTFNNFHPLFLYESLLNFTLFILLYKNREKLKGQNGLISAYYLMGYACIRFVLDFVRINQWYIGPIIVSQLLSIAAFVIALTFIILKKVGKV